MLRIFSVQDGAIGASVRDKAVDFLSESTTKKYNITLRKPAEHCFYTTFLCNLSNPSWGATEKRYVSGLVIQVTDQVCEDADPFLQLADLDELVRLVRLFYRSGAADNGGNTGPVKLPRLGRKRHCAKCIIAGQGPCQALSRVVGNRCERGNVAMASHGHTAFGKLRSYALVHHFNRGIEGLQDLIGVKARRAAQIEPKDTAPCQDIGGSAA